MFSSLNFMPTVKVPFSHIFSDRKYSKQYIHVILLVSYHYGSIQKQGKSEGFDSCNRPSNLKLDSNRRFSACVVVKSDG